MSKLTCKKFHVDLKGELSLRLKKKSCKKNHSKKKLCKRIPLTKACKFKKMIGQTVLLVTDADQLEILGQTFRPIFCGTIIGVSDNAIKLDPVQIKMHNAPEFTFPTPLLFPIDRIVVATPFDCDVRFPLS